MWHLPLLMQQDMDSIMEEGFSWHARVIPSLLGIEIVVMQHCAQG